MCITADPAVQEGRSPGGHSCRWALIGESLAMQAVIDVAAAGGAERGDGAARSFCSRALLTPSWSRPGAARRYQQPLAGEGPAASSPASGSSGATRSMAWTPSTRAGVGSSDVGNVSQALPTIQPWIGILQAGEPDVAFHTREFWDVAATDHAHRRMGAAACALALTALDVLGDPRVLRGARGEFGQAGPQR